MRTSVAGVVVASALAAASGAAAKGQPPYAVGICGPSGCAAVVAVEHWSQPAWLSDHSARSGPAAPGPFYTLGMLVSERTTTPVAFYVPSAGLLKLKGSVVGHGAATWFRIAPNVARLLEQASAGLRPFRRPSISWAMVGSRWVKEPARYGRLYAVAGPPAADPAGAPPSMQYQTPADRDAWLAVWGPYLARVEAEWIPVQMATRPFSPWDVRESFVWIGRRADILKRDGEVIRLPPFLAELVRRGAQL